MPLPELSAIRDKTQQVFGRRACLWQLKVAEAILKKDKDVVCISGTGSGKTLTFWMLLLFHDGIQVIITPLNILGDQNTEQLSTWGIKAIVISGENATHDNLKVGLAFQQKSGMC